MESTSTLTARRGPATTRERALAPDLARGAMLLLIVLANTPYYLWGLDHGMVFGHPTSGSAADRAVQAVMMVTVDLRTYPMFAFLFGYGIVQLAGRQQAAGTPEPLVRRLLRRRHWWLVAFGLVHAALLWEGDILGIYGLVGLVTCWLFLRRRDVTLRVWSVVLLVLMLVGTALVVLAAVSVSDVLTVEEAGSGPDVGNAIANPDYLASVGDRLTTWGILLVLQGALTLVIPLVVLLAFQAGRHRVLEEPERHLPLLRRVAVGGVAVGWLGGLPSALDHLGVVDVPDAVSWALFPVHATTGMFAGDRLRRVLRPAGAPARVPARRARTGGHGAARPGRALAVGVPGPVGDLRTAARGVGPRPRPPPVELVDGGRGRGRCGCSPSWPPTRSPGGAGAGRPRWRCGGWSTATPPGG